MKNYYKTLGINQNSSREEIKKAFRELAFKYHPDKNTDQVSTEKFKEINEAKQVLLDDLKKFHYDETLVFFLSKNSITGKIRGFKRKNILTSSPHFQLIKETVLDKFFLAILFIVTILSTIAFYKIPDDEPFSAPPLIANSVSVTEKEPSTKPVIEASYAPKKALKKKIFGIDPGKKTFKHKSSTPSLSFSKKAARKLHVLQQIKIARNMEIPRAKAKKKTIKTAPFATTKIEGEKGLQKQLSNGKMVEILNQIKAEKQKLGSNSNCIQVIKSEKSNISNVFMLANFLRSYGYVISGREKIPENINGINIDAMSDCITITVGTL